MSFAIFCSAFITANILIVIVVMINVFLKTVPPRQKLNLNYTLLLLILVFPLLQILTPRESAKYLPAKSMIGFVKGQENMKVPLPIVRLAPGPLFFTEHDQGSEDNATLIMAILTFSWSLAAFVFLREIQKIRRLRNNSYRLRKIGRVLILAHDEIATPFSCWFFGQALVFLPNKYLEQVSLFKLGLAHEIQHHRARDTVWIYAMFLIKSFFILNPCVRIWSRQISELQEFACDATLVDRKKVESQAYARCLLEAAKSALAFRERPACATGFFTAGDSHFLKRRIQSMLQPKQTRTSRFRATLLLSASLSLMAIASYASSGIVQDRHLTMAQAKALAASSSLDNASFMVVNELVLKQLNHYLGTKTGRDFMKVSLGRMKLHQAVLSQAMEAYQVPEALAAIPIVESGYQNWSEDEGGSSQNSAGLWRFIRSTAKHYGLKINDQVDERLDVTLETDAAMRYLRSNRILFNDWLLAILAYNLGESRVQNAIKQFKTKDAWSLIRNGVENDQNYLAKVVAAMLIMKNPQILN